ncbi:MAG: PEP-CTERM sorting domain-containing protein [Akkermansia sp.]|nr:PEP-CTERM sorting domain-containing protein [Akkermansia sp.]
MKKTIITILAMAGVAVADSVTVTPLTADATEWSDISLRDRATWTHDATAGTMTLNNSNWGQAVSTYDLTPNLILESFSFNLSRGTASAGVSITLIGMDEAISFGSKDYTSGELFYGKTTTIDAASYSLNTAWDEGTTVTPTSLLADALNYNATASISGTTAVNADGELILTLSASSTATSNTGSATINLGKDFVLDKIMICGDGANNSTGIWTVSNMSVKGTPVIPEPTTATLSLLALAGLAARRRRR